MPFMQLCDGQKMKPRSVTPALPIPADPTAEIPMPTQEEYDRLPDGLDEDGHLEPLGLWDEDDDDLNNDDCEASHCAT